MLSEEQKADIAAAFQETALKEIVDKSLKAADAFHCRSIFLGGGVSNNQRLRQLFVERGPSIQIYWPSAGLSLDNAAMIAGLGYHQFLKQGNSDPFDLEPMTRIPL